MCSLTWCTLSRSNWAARLQCARAAAHGSVEAAGPGRKGQQRVCQRDGHGTRQHNVVDRVDNALRGSRGW